MSVPAVESAQQPEHTASQFILLKHRNQRFDFSRYTQFLGLSFVKSACEAIEQKKDGIKPKSWRDNYVVPLERLLISLILFLRRHARPAGLQPIALSASQWQSFAQWYRQRIVGMPLANRTKTKSLTSANIVLLSLFAAQTIPYRIELPRLAHDGTKPRPFLSYKEKHTLRQHEQSPSKPEEITEYCFRLPKTKGRFDYSRFAVLGHHFMRAVVKQLRVTFAAYQNPKNLHNTWRAFLSFLMTIAASEGKNKFFKKLRTPQFRNIPDLEWEHYVYAWRDTLRSSCKPSSAHLKVNMLRTVWRSLTQAGLVPYVPIKAAKGGRSRKHCSRRKTLAQLSANQIGNRSEAERRLWARIEHLFEPTERSEAREYVRALSAELPPRLFASLSVEDLIGELQKLNSKRLVMLRQMAEREITLWYRHWCRGQEVMRHASHPADMLVDLVDSPLRSISERRRNSGRLFYRCDKQTRTGNILAYVLATTGGSVQAATGRFHHLARLIGSRDEVHAYLRPHDSATIALWTLLLVDTGANCEVVREMPLDCMADTEDPEHKKIFFDAKLRAGGQVIVDHLPVLPPRGQSLSSVQAIMQYKEMSAHLRNRTAEVEQKHLLLYERKGGQPVRLTEWFGRDQFKRLVSHSDALVGLSAVPSMIRPSVLLELQFRHPGKVAAAQVVADHAKVSTTLSHYTERTPVTLQYTLLIREFQERYQAVIIVSIDDVPRRLGLAKEEFERVFSDASRTGLGVACLNPTAGIQPGTHEGEPCTRLDRCCQCKMRWVVATPNNVADLILFNEYLKSAQDFASPSRWEHVWLPWLVFSEVVLAKLKQGETVRVFEEGRVRADERRQDYKPIPLI